jgi:hypothetical protein
VNAHFLSNAEVFSYFMVQSEKQREHGIARSGTSNLMG